MIITHLIRTCRLSDARAIVGDALTDTSCSNQPAALSEHVVRIGNLCELFEEQSDEFRRNFRVYEDSA